MELRKNKYWRQAKRSIRRHSRGPHWWGLASILLVVAAAALWFNFQPDNPESASSDQSPANTTAPATTVGLSSRVLFTGNIFWGRAINDWAMANPLKYAHPFSKLDTLNREAYQAWVGGLECPTVPGVTPTAYEEETLLKFNCSPSYLPEFRKWFNIVTLANNHTDNQGASGFTKTQQQLSKNNIQYFGHYDPRVTKDTCEVVALPVKLRLSDGSAREGNLPVAMCGYHGVFRVPPAEAIAEISRYSPYMPVFAMPHMGAEYEASPDSLRTRLYRTMIDAGADAVLGDHPHWVQTTEAYKGHLIVYSMGNFIFDQQGSLETTRAAAIDVTIETSDTAELERWLSVGEQCSIYKDNCLDLIKQNQLSKPDFSYKFGVVVVDNSSGVTTLASSQKRAAVLDRLQWSKTINRLQTPYSKL